MSVPKQDDRWFEDPEQFLDYWLYEGDIGRPDALWGIVTCVNPLGEVKYAVMYDALDSVGNPAALEDDLRSMVCYFAVRYRRTARRADDVLLDFLFSGHVTPGVL